MKRLITAAMICLLATPTIAQEGRSMNATPISPEDVRAVAPGLARYAEEDVAGRLWQRPQLSPRDRSIVTLAILIARNQIADQVYYANLALDNGVKPAEISEIVTHLAFYAGWPNAMSAIPLLKDVFAQRGIRADQLPAASPTLLPLDAASESRRHTTVGENIGPISPGLHEFTTDPLFLDVWLRPDLSPRDRSLVTISALIANGQMAQYRSHLGRALDNGVTQEEAGEVITQAAFYAGWPTAFSAAPVAKEVFDSRQNPK